MQPQARNLVAVVGAGPAGLFAARELAQSGSMSFYFNRDVKPGGLAEYGIFLEKLKMKNGLRAQFRQILSLDLIDYFGNIRLAKDSRLSLETLNELGFQAVLVAVGAQGTKWIGLPGEHLNGIFHAKDLVYHYNGLPPFSQRNFNIGKRVVIVGVGNVMTDIARYLITYRQVDTITAIARRGPAEVKFDRKEIEHIAGCMNMNEINAEIGSAAGMMQKIGQKPEESLAFFEAAINRSDQTVSKTHLSLRFLLSPTRILGDDLGKVIGLEVEENDLVNDGSSVRAVGTGKKSVLEADTVIFAIGDSVDEGIGLPVYKGEYSKDPEPRFPVENTSYEAYDREKGSPLDGIFLAGWSRRASNGVVGNARKDGVNGARAVMQYLQTLPPLEHLPLERINLYINNSGEQIVRKEHLLLLEAAEMERAKESGMIEYKFNTNEEMLAVIRMPV